MADLEVQVNKISPHIYFESIDNDGLIIEHNTLKEAKERIKKIGGIVLKYDTYKREISLSYKHKAF